MLGNSTPRHDRNLSKTVHNIKERHRRHLAHPTIILTLSVGGSDNPMFKFTWSEELVDVFRPPFFLRLGGATGAGISPAAGVELVLCCALLLLFSDAGGLFFELANLVLAMTSGS